MVPSRLAPVRPDVGDAWAEQKISVDVMQEEVEHIQAWLGMGTPDACSHPARWQDEAKTVPQRGAASSSCFNAPLVGDAEISMMGLDGQWSTDPVPLLAASSTMAGKPMDQACFHSSCGDSTGSSQAHPINQAAMTLEARYETQREVQRKQMGQLHLELQQTTDGWQSEVSQQKAQHALLKEEYTALAAHMADVTAGKCRDLPQQDRTSGNAIALAHLKREVAAWQSRICVLADSVLGFEGALASQASPADVGAQRDVLRLLLRMVSRLQQRVQASADEQDTLDQRASTTEVGGEEEEEEERRWHPDSCHAAEALVSMQSDLSRLRHMYQAMGVAFEQRMESECLGGHVDPWGMRSHAGAEDLLVREHACLQKKEQEARQLASELAAAERGRAFAAEQERLEAAAYGDILVQDELRRQLFRNNARNAAVELE